MTVEEGFVSENSGRWGRRKAEGRAQVLVLLDCFVCMRESVSTLRAAEEIWGGVPGPS